MNNQFYQILDWDAEILGIPTAKIIPERLSAEQLNLIIKNLKNQNIKLIFWASESTDLISQQAAQEFNGFLADYKVTYCQKISNLNFSDYDFNQITAYTEKLPTADMVELAYEIGRFSRFANDPKISTAQMEKVYKTWLENSTKRLIAKEVLVIKDQDKVIGMTTLGEKNKRGDIGLIAVDPNYRGRNLGTMLVKASQNWSKLNNYQYTQVVTQKTNPNACKLYEKCGYSIDKIEHFYHFWL